MVEFIGDPLCVEFLRVAAVWAMYLIVLSSTVQGIIGIIKPPEVWFFFFLKEGNARYGISHFIRIIN